MSTVQVEKKDTMQETNAVQTIHFKSQLELNEKRRQERDHKVAQIFKELDGMLDELNLNNKSNN
ncbi:MULTISPECIES: hypothetical protein [Niallia]|uniref:Uncharacterized protein n=2 Tax=Niallia TaxID=2837506 RepID=A0A437K7T8_9BACI|nr:MULTISPECIES: hypothetical protein [Niallia]MDK8642473.1 hypothetical protein [Niallia taxi]MED4040549.1 hypothetical protein [Niallia taxi]MED4056989.1 hypothetical protein [Niallia taxi]MED4121665.1 hypothetical protein [Niallia taxi]RVT59505.1 hypothetical protein EM808_19620 [Niallia taxi]